MWIAKPLAALSRAERLSWIETQNPERPLSQTLTWAEAAFAAIAPHQGQVYVIFNPQEGVGGIVHSAGAPTDYECTNGPVLDWQSDQAPRQIATFAMAVSRASKNLRILQLHPRWIEGSELETEAILEDLPIPAEGLSRASTLVVDLKDSVSVQRQGFTPRLMRTIESSLHSGVNARRVPLSTEVIANFVSSMRHYGQGKGFYVPEEIWFQTLLASDPERPREATEFFLIEATLGEQARTQLLCCKNQMNVHYLFGFDSREDSLNSSISTAAIAHDLAMQEASKMGCLIYDFNGYIDPNDPDQADHPYLGVSRFKAQFGGRVINYASPEFRIENGS